MEIEFSPLEGESKKFYAFMAVLFGLAAAGLLATYLMAAKGLYLSGMTNHVPWGISIVMAIYYIGLSAGSLVLSAMSAVFGRKEFKPFARLAALLAMFLLVGALLMDENQVPRLCRLADERFGDVDPSELASRVVVCSMSEKIEKRPELVSPRDFAPRKVGRTTSS